MALTNGDFEDGDFTGWTTDTSQGSGTHTNSATVTTGAKHSGTYGARLYITAENSGWGGASITTPLDDTGWDFLLFYLKINSLTRNYSGYSEIYLKCQMTISSTPTWITVRMIPDSECNAWRSHIVLWAELEKLRTDNSGTWADDEIPFKIEVYHCSAQVPASSCEVFLDDFAICALGFANGDFEDGALTDWIDTSYVYMNSSDELAGTGAVSASTTEKHAGSYSGKFQNTFLETIGDGAIYTTIEQPLEVSAFSGISFWYKVTDATGGNPKCQLRMWVYNTDYETCEFATVWEITGGDDFTEGSWTEVTMTKTEIEATFFHQEFLDTTVLQFVSNIVDIPS
jgi:hypothetical protein